MQIILNIFLLTGTVIGAGIFSLPIIFERLGVIFYLLLFLLGFLTAYLGVKYRHLIDSLKTQNQMPSYIGASLGPLWKKISLILFAFSLAGALISYLLLIKEQIGSIYIFLSFSWAILLLNLKTIKKFDSILTIILLISILFLILQAEGLQFLPQVFLPESINLKDFVKAYGVILFSFTGFSVIPDLVKKGRPKTAINTSYLIITLIYLYFANFVDMKNQNLLLKTVIFFAVITSYIPLSFVLEETLEKDLGIKRIASKAITLATPVVVVLWGVADFISALSITGGVFISLLQILIVIAYIKLKKPRGLLERALLILTCLIFLLGAASEVYFLF